MKKLAIVGFIFIALLTACPTNTKKADPDPGKVYDAAPIENPIVRDSRLQMVEDDKETSYLSVPMKLDDKIGFGLIAITRRDGTKLTPTEITVKFLGEHEEGRWRECLTATPHLNGKASSLSSKPIYFSKEKGKLVIETMSVRLTVSELAAMAFAKELAIWLCEDIVTFKADDQKVLQAMDSELRSPSLE